MKKISESRPSPRVLTVIKKRVILEAIFEVK